VAGKVRRSVQNCPGYGDQIQVLLRCQNSARWCRETTPYFPLPQHTDGMRFRAILTPHRMFNGAARCERETVKNREGQYLTHVLWGTRGSAVPTSNQHSANCPRIATLRLFERPTYTSPFG
jgi:hypothetical protein